MREAGKAAGFTPEACLVVFVPAVFIVQNLDRYPPVEGVVPAAVDLPHATFADPGLDLVGSDLFPQFLLCPGVLPLGGTRERSCAGMVSFWRESFIHNYILNKILWIFIGENCG